MKGALAAAAALAAPGHADRGLHLVQWSDVHWGSDQDAPAAWQEALQRGLKEKPELLLFTGDQSDNGLGRGDFAERTRGFWGPTLEAVGTADFLLTLGNADFRQNYQTDPENLAETALLHKELLGSRYYLDELGNGARDHSGLRWISLNTQIFSPKNRYPGAARQSEASLDWLAGQLDGKPAVLLLHIPPIVDLYTGHEAWNSQPLRRFWQLGRAHKGPLTILSGHFHRNEVHACGRAQGDAALLVGGSLSRKYDYQPNWRSYRWRLGKAGQLLGADYRLSYPGRGDTDYQLAEPSSFLAQVDRTTYLNDVFARHPEVKDRWKELKEQFWIP